MPEPIFTALASRYSLPVSIESYEDIEQFFGYLIHTKGLKDFDPDKPFEEYKDGRGDYRFTDVWGSGETDADIFAALMREARAFADEVGIDIYDLAARAV